jgi:hypothetical protein
MSSAVWAKSGLNLLKFHSNLVCLTGQHSWIPVRNFRISSNSVSTEIFLKKNPKTLAAAGRGCRALADYWLPVASRGWLLGGCGLPKAGCCWLMDGHGLAWLG